MHNFYSGHVGRAFGKIALTMGTSIVAANGATTFAWVLVGVIWIWVIAEMIGTHEDVDGGIMST